MTAEEIRFDEEAHKYYAGDVEVPGVSFLMEHMGLKPGLFRLDPFYAIRGRYIHKACHMDTEGRLDDSTVDPQIKGYLDAWRKFRALTNLKAHSMERLVYSEEWQYCGTYDFLGWMNDEAILTLLDIKSGGPASWHVHQLAAYALASPDGPSRIGNVYLKGDGKFQLRMYSPTDLALSVHIWKDTMRKYNERRAIEWL